ncbi:hypothetical protein BDN70DRAFT_935026 [Pholiota conissans]|uniref:Uncharacterized protein n=1 Tax=Pholiota conissans TaxID=109636 RepID=A0A9P5YXP3_9AGAR|nr:hypothetical protein BDN70DRAFT_935026 [Pholiota conissans]
MTELDAVCSNPAANQAHPSHGHHHVIHGHFMPPRVQAFLILSTHSSGQFQMQEPAKRVLTDDLHNAHIASDQPPSSSDLPDELLQRLRSAGSRVRKSVTEGYRTTPSSFSRAQSTGAIFSSMNDTMRDIYANPQNTTSHASAARKRTLSFSEVAEPGTMAEGAEISIDDAPSTESPAADANPMPRKIRPLRAPSRAFLQTQSLPVGALTFAGSTKPSAITASTEPVAEEDWSFENSFQPSQPAFEPMVFD